MSRREGWMAVSANDGVDHGGLREFEDMGIARADCPLE
jgi:hypothetical protein